LNRRESLGHGHAWHALATVLHAAAPDFLAVLVKHSLDGVFEDDVG
jgi:hypothetical protein